MQHRLSEVQPPESPAPGGTALVTSLENSEWHPFSGAKSGIKCLHGLGRGFSMGDRMMTFLATGPETINESVIWIIHCLSQPENGHIQSYPPAEIHTTFPSRLLKATI